VAVGAWETEHDAPSGAHDLGCHVQAEVEVALQLADRFFGATAAQAVVMLDFCAGAQTGIDVDDDRMEALPLEIV